MTQSSPKEKRETVLRGFYAPAVGRTLIPVALNAGALAMTHSHWNERVHHYHRGRL